MCRLFVYPENPKYGLIYVYSENLIIFSKTRRFLVFLPYIVEILLHISSQMFAAVGIRHGMEKMQQAFEIYPYCAMSLNYLANHFFFTGQHFLVEQLTETALSVTLHGPTKAHSYYNLARSYHSKVGPLHLCLPLCHLCLVENFFLGPKIQTSLYSPIKKKRMLIFMSSFSINF